jgi:S-DNA-T family DNA segregation ATPase FtsK/SpoIIIE
MSGRTRTGNEGLLGSDDVVAVLVEAVLWTTWGMLRAVVSVLSTMVRHPLMTAMGLALVACWAFLGWRGVAVVVAAGALALGTWRVWHPPTYQAYVQVAALTLVRSAYYRARWGHIAQNVDLIVHDREKSRLRRPKNRGTSSRSVQLVKVRATSHGTDRLLFRLPTGLVPADVATQGDAIAHATGCLSATVRPDRPGRCWLELKRRDDLVRTVPPVLASETVQLHAVPIGRREDGGPWQLKVAGTHLLVAGATGTGKSSVLWSLLQGVSRGLSSGVVQVWAVDPKGGMELRPGRALFTRYEDASSEDMCRLLEDLVDVKDTRSRHLADAGARVHQPTPESPHIIAVLDELATLTAFADRTVTRRIDTALGMLLTQGRACGTTVVAAVQDPVKDIVGWRDLFPTRVAMRLDNPLQVSMVLGDSARDDGARADEISELTPGVAYVRIDGTREIVRARAAYLDDQDIARLVNDVTTRRVSHTAGEDSPEHVLTTADLPATMRANREGDQS